MYTTFKTYLTELQVDTILACGGSTSGCVRASVVDGSSGGYRMGLIEECTFDRGLASHAINLFRDTLNKSVDKGGIVP